VTLAKIIATPSNLLLLDEPTNHLDMQSIDALVGALETYEGAVVIVTHSEMILRDIATNSWSFRMARRHGSTGRMMIF
jgi:ATP-binding cassette subfamily F protein 3